VLSSGYPSTVARRGPSSCPPMAHRAAISSANAQVHPTDSEKEIVYVCLEGGEAGTYARGTGQLSDGRGTIDLPEHFGLVTCNRGLTVHLTPRGDWLQLFVESLSPSHCVVREAQGKSGVFDYLVHGVRRGFEGHEAIRARELPKDPEAGGDRP
jgi:hypothetical protein